MQRGDEERKAKEVRERKRMVRGRGKGGEG